MHQLSSARGRSTHLFLDLTQPIWVLTVYYQGKQGRKTSNKSLTRRRPQPCASSWSTSGIPLQCTGGPRIRGPLSGSGWEIPAEHGIRDRCQVPGLIHEGRDIRPGHVKTGCFQIGGRPLTKIPGRWAASLRSNTLGGPRTGGCAVARTAGPGVPSIFLLQISSVGSMGRKPRFCNPSYANTSLSSSFRNVWPIRRNTGDKSWASAIQMASSRAK